MNKFIFVFLLMAGVMSSPLQATAEPSPSQNQPICVTTGNVSATVKLNNANHSYYVSFKNYNDYTVTVTWSVWGTDTEARTRKIAGGTKTLAKSGNDDVYFGCPTGVDGLWVETSVQKCE